MVRITVQIDGMRCPMCESHVNDTIRNRFSVEKVTSSHKEKKTEIISKLPLDEEAIQATVTALGYEVRGICTEPYEKKGFFSRFRK